MRDELLTLQFPDTLYAFTNWVLLLVSAAIFLVILLRHRDLLVKPSLWLLLYCHVLFQWPCTLLAGFYENFLPNPFDLVLIVHMFVLSGLALVFLTFRRSTKEIWNTLRPSDTDEAVSSLSLAIKLMLIVLVALLAIYLAYVPIRATGLYAILFDPIQASIAREESLKLLESRVPKYAYSFALSAAAPLLASLATVRLIDSGWLNRTSLFHYGCILLALATSAMTGARVGPVLIILVVAFTYLFRRQFEVNLLGIGLVVLLSLVPAVALSLLREGQSIGALAERGLEYLIYIANRTFVVPFEVGAWYVHYAQSIGLDTSPLTAWKTERAANYANVIGLTYAPRFYGSTLTTISAPAGFPFAFYLFYGLAGTALSFIGLLLVDLTTIVIARLNSALVIVAVSTLAVGALSFTQSEYATTWLTHGFGVKLALLVALTATIHLFRRNVIRQA